VTGRLYRGGADRLAAAMAGYAAAPELARAHGAAGWAAARRRYSVEACVAQVSEVIRGVVPGGG
jgi:glycosyltransferase involved in cell wall biosynthesis